MKLSRTLSVALVLAFLAAAFPARAFDAGAAKVEITPPLGTPLNGYFDRLGRGALSVHDPVWVRCLYLDDGETRVFLVCADLCVINRELAEAALAKAPNVVPRENIYLTATHTHSAQGGMIEPLLFRSISGRYMPEVLEATATRFAEAMQAAYDARRRATIGYGVTMQKSLSTNRRVSGGPIDEQIGVIRVNDSDGNAIAIVGNFAAHPTTVPERDGLCVSADFCGYFYDELERLATPGCVAMLTQGAQGNQRCGNPEEKEGWERTESIGKLLAEFVKGAANKIECKEAKLHVAQARPALPPSIAGALLPSDTVIKSLEIGDLLLNFFPGEPCVEIGLELRKQALARGYGNQFSVGLANDHLLYFIPRTRYGKLEYESGMNFYGPGIEDWFYREFSKQMTRGEVIDPRMIGEPERVAFVSGAQHLVLRGTPYQIGYARGAAFEEAIKARYEGEDRRALRFRGTHS